MRQLKSGSGTAWLIVRARIALRRSNLRQVGAYADTGGLRMAESNDQDEPPVPTSLILRMTARLWRLPPQRRDAYVSRARAHFDAGRGLRNDHALLRAIDVASLPGAKT